MIDLSHIEHNAEEAAHLIKAMSNDKRLKILCALCKKEQNVSELEHYVDLSQSALSQHLAKMREHGLVKTRREAQTIYYSLKCENIKKLLATLSEICSPGNQIPAEILKQIKEEALTKTGRT